MTEKELAVIEAMKIIKEYCKNGCLECIFENLCNENPRDWEIPERKTRKDLLIENFPFAEIDGQGIPTACAKELGITDKCFAGGQGCEKCWAEEIEND